MGRDTDEHVAVSRTRSPREAHEHALVLRARGIAFVRVISEGEHVIAVAPEDAQRAAAEIARYEEENAEWPPEREAPPTLGDGKTAALAWCVACVLVYLLDREGVGGLPWHDAGRVDAERILSGEWWRSVTALTLHADLAHLAGNLVFGAAFTALACQLLGTGAGLLGILAAGALGNVANVLLKGSAHLSVGASTAVFGAIGLQTAHLFVLRRRGRYGAIYVWAPLVLGVAFLAFLGMPLVRPDEIATADFESMGTDFTAHATGFAAGAMLGGAAGLGSPRWLARHAVQRAAAVLALAALAVAWARALV